MCLKEQTVVLVCPAKGYQNAAFVGEYSFEAQVFGFALAGLVIQDVERKAL